MLTNQHTDVLAMTRGQTFTKSSVVDGFGLEILCLNIKIFLGLK